jgi:iron-sulfur cluster repair protein YtfE (RIC family)
MRHPSLIPLSHDHHHGLALALRCRKQALGQLKPMGLKGLKERTQEMRDFFANNLVAHFRAEEEVLFPRIRGLVPESAEIVEQLMDEHRQLRDAVAQLDTDAGLGKLLFNFGDLLERHIRKEERELFPLFEQHIGETAAAAVGAEIKTILGPSGLL